MVINNYRVTKLKLRDFTKISQFYFLSMKFKILIKKTVQVQILTSRA